MNNNHSNLKIRQQISNLYFEFVKKKKTILIKYDTANLKLYNDF